MPTSRERASRHAILRGWAPVRLRPARGPCARDELAFLLGRLPIELGEPLGMVDVHPLEYRITHASRL
jgi:hypothetical protein